MPNEWAYFPKILNISHKAKNKGMSTTNQLKNIIKSIKSSPVLVIGDIMLDKFIYGDVDRISPESPVPVLSIKREDEMLGGAGNAVANLAGLETNPLQNLNG